MCCLKYFDMANDVGFGDGGEAWAKEAARRFETYILPLLQEQNLFLDVWLVIFDSSSTAHLVAEKAAPDSFLGYDPLGRSAHPPPVQRVLLYSDHTEPR